MRNLRRFAALLLLLGCAACIAAPAAHAQDRADAAVRERMLRTLDLVRPGAAQLLLNAVPAARAAATDGVIAGKLTGLDADAFASAAVMAWNDSTAQGDSTAARVGFAVLLPDGTYRIEGLASGYYFVVASARGYATQYYDGAADMGRATPVFVPPADTVRGIDFAMERFVPGGGSIAGTVRAEGGEPVAGASVYAFSPENPFRYGAGETGRDGAYVVAGLETGRYVVHVSAPGYLPAFYDGAASLDAATRVEVTSPERTAGIDVVLARGASISGLVRNTEGAPLAGVYVQASRPSLSDSTGNAWLPSVYGGWALSGEDGRYRIDGLSADSYTVSAHASTRWSYASQWYDGAASVEAATPVVVAAGAETGAIDFDLALPAARSTLAGRVVDAEGQPLPDAFVAVQHAEAGSEGPYIWAYATTDRDGRYMVEELPAGRYLVSASAQSGWEYVQRWYPGAPAPEMATPVTVGESERVEGIDVTLPLRAGTASLAGVVRDAAGNGLPGAFVDVTPSPVGSAIQPGTLWAYATTDSAGAYRVDGLPAGMYSVHASYWNGDRFGQGWYDGAATPDEADPVVLTDGAAREGVDLRFDVRPWYGTVAGTITDAATGSPVARAYVELSPVARDVLMDAPFRYHVSYAVANEDGRFEITYMPAGSYQATVYADGMDGATDPVRVDVVGGEVAFVDAALTVRDDGEGSISGIVTIDYGEWREVPDLRSAHWSAPGRGLRAGQRLAADGTPPEVAVVVALPVEAAVTDVRYTAVTAPDGTYQLRGLAPGTYVVMGFAPGYVGEYYDDTFVPEEATLVHAGAMVPAAGIDFELTPAYFFWTRDIANNGNIVAGRVTSADGVPVEGATVYLLDEAKRPIASVQTGGDGRYELQGAPVGNYRIYAGKVGFDGRYNGEVRLFEEAQPIALNGSRLEVNLVLSPVHATGTDDEADVPRALVLSANYPNPFNPSTRLTFTVPAHGPARVRVFDVLGREVALLFDGPAEAGRRYELDFAAGTLATGVYVYTLEHAGKRMARTMILAK